MKIINFFAGPGAGKSTIAMELTAKLKWLNYKVEYVPEYAKDLVWEGKLNGSYSQQIEIWNEQLFRLQRLFSHDLDFIVTDSPMLLSLYYARQSGLDILKLFNEYEAIRCKYTHINIFLKRTKPYQKYGRNQTFEEAKQADLGVQDFLDEFSISYALLPADQKCADLIIKGYL